MSSIKTHYENLQVSRKASPEVIRAAYKGLTQRYHPDRHPEDRARYERVMKIINEAFEVLSDPRKRAEHDAWILEQENTKPKRDANTGSAASRPDPTRRANQASSSENYAGTAQAFRESRINSAAPGATPRRAEPATAEASQILSSQSLSGPRQKPLVSWRDWLAGICALACVLVAWTTWDTAGPMLLLVGLGLFVWLFARAVNQQALLETSQLGASYSSRSNNVQAKPMWAWGVLGIAALAVVAISSTIAAMTLGESRAGRVTVAIGSVALVLLGVCWVARRLRNSSDKGTHPRKADDVAWWLAALVWGWLAYALTPHHLGFAWSDYAIFAAVLLAGWVPAYGACRVLLAPGKRADLTWKRVSGYLFLMTLVVAIVFILRGTDPSLMPTHALNNGVFPLSLAHYLGIFIGALLSAALLTAILIGVGAAVSAAAGYICEQLKMTRPRTKVTALLVGWAVIPVAFGLVRLANWV